MLSDVFLSVKNVHFISETKALCHAFVHYVTSTGWAKNDTLFYMPITSPNINQFSNLFHCQNKEKIFSNIITKEPTLPHVCHCTTRWNISVLKAPIENKTISLATHCNKITTGNNLFIVSVIVQFNCHISHFSHRMFNMSVLLLDDALKPTTPPTSGLINQMLWQSTPLSDDRLLQLVG